MATAPPPPYHDPSSEQTPVAGPMGGGQQPPPQAGYPYQPPPAYGATSSANTVVVTPPVVAIVQSFREAPVRTICPCCKADVITATEYKTGWMPWLACGLIAFFGGIFGCCLIPFCIDGLQDVVHVCPNCHHQIAIWHRFS